MPYDVTGLSDREVVNLEQIMDAPSDEHVRTLVEFARGEALIVIGTPPAHTLFSCAVCESSCPSLLSQFVLQVAVIKLDSFHAHAWLKHNMKLGTLCLAQKCSRDRAPCHTSHLC